MALEKHQWINRYDAPLPPDQTITGNAGAAAVAAGGGAAAAPAEDEYGRRRLEEHSAGPGAAAETPQRAPEVERGPQEAQERKLLEMVINGGDANQKQAEFEKPVDELGRQELAEHESGRTESPAANKDLLTEK